MTDGEADTTDHVLQFALLRLAFDHPEPNTIALLTGDGAGINSGRGFLADAKRLSERGWKYEVYSWDVVCHSQLKEFAKMYGKYEFCSMSIVGVESYIKKLMLSLSVGMSF